MNSQDIIRGFKEFMRRGSHTRIFSNIYMKGVWGRKGSHSGPGSMLKYNRGYIEFLKSFFEENNINSVIDLGYGDWAFSKALYPSTELEYLGIDCVPFLIENNKDKFSTDKINFLCLDILKFFDEIPSADVYIVKDVMQHWVNEEIISFLGKWKKNKKSKYMLIINGVSRSKNRTKDLDYGTKNDLVETGANNRFLPITHDVFKDLELTKIYEYHEEKDKKEVYLCSLK